MRKKYQINNEKRMFSQEVSEELLEQTLLEQEQNKRKSEAESQILKPEDLKEKYQALGLFSEDTVFYEVNAEESLKQHASVPPSEDAFVSEPLTAYEKQWLKQIQTKEQLRQKQLSQALQKDRQQASHRRKRPGFIKSLWGPISLEPRYRSLVVGFSVLLFLISVLFLLPIFRMERIEVSGLYQLTRQQVVQVSQLKEGQHLLTRLGGDLETWLTLRYGRAERALKQTFTEIESVKVYPQFPGVIKIDLVERVPLTYLKIDEAYAQIDKEGVVMKISSTPPKDAPVIVGKTSESIKTGQKISYSLRNSIGKTMLVLYEILKLDESLEDGYYLIDQIESIRILSREAILLVLKAEKNEEDDTENVYYIRFSTSEKIKENTDWLRQALKSKVFEKLGTGLIDISGRQKVFLPVKNILPYEREDLKVDELSFFTNPILIEEETLNNRTEDSSEEIEVESTAGLASTSQP